MEVVSISSNGQGWNYGGEGPGLRMATREGQRKATGRELRGRDTGKAKCSKSVSGELGGGP